MRHKIRLEGILTPEHEAMHYTYLPFTVPAGTRRLEVSYHYDNQTQGAKETHPGNSIDIGLFDVRGADFLTGGFRGWSGTSRNSFFIAPDAATPGYLRGPIQPGEWSIMLGCPQIQDARVPYRVNVELDIDPDAMDEAVGEPRVPGMPRVEVVAGGSNGSGGKWYRGDLHAHSEHSDGQNTVEEIVNYTRQVGLEYFALTDHNTISHWDELARLNDRAPLLIPGEEVTMYGGHANVWGLEDWLDFRGAGDQVKIQQLVEQANARGSMFSINHPDSPIPWKYGGVGGYQAIEVWNAPWRWFNEPALQRWEGHLQRGERMVAVGGSDSHCVPPATMTQPNGPGEPCTWAYVEGPLTQRAVLDAVSLGHVFISEAPNGPFIELRADADGDGMFETLPGDLIAEPGERVVRFHVKYRGPDGKHLRFFSKGGLVKELTPAVEAYDDEFELRLEGDDFLRCEVRGFRGRPDRGEVVHAMTNPVYWGAWR